LYWNQRFEREGWHTEPSTFLLSLDATLPFKGNALDLAGGTGRNALWLAERGLETTLLDISDTGLGIARKAAEERGLSIELINADLEHDVLPKGPWDLVICTNYLHRATLPKLASLLTPSGLVALELATRTNLERHSRPPERFLLDEGEILTLLPGLELVEYHERWWDDRHVAQVVGKVLDD
jgi:2-polyprenyl-3-methyl-5-hydroxy-6-metoxy-1,4-benzoquinol methylase